MRRHYLNLTNGLEALSELLAAGETYSFLRIRSTTVERLDWHLLLVEELGADLLMHLALGHECVVHDRGTLRLLSKTLYHAVPLVKYVLTRRWYNEHAAEAEVVSLGPRGGQAPDRRAEFKEIYAAVVEAPSPEGARVRSMLDYFGRYRSGGVVRLTTSGGSTTHDGDRLYYWRLSEQAWPGRAPCPDRIMQTFVRALERVQDPIPEELQQEVHCSTSAGGTTSRASPSARRCCGSSTLPRATPCGCTPLRCACRSAPGSRTGRGSRRSSPSCGSGGTRSARPCAARSSWR